MSDFQQSYIREHYRDLSTVKIAKAINTSTETVRRYLIITGLRIDPSGHYSFVRPEKAKVWSRPCMQCGSTQERPKAWYMCGPCRKKIGYSECIP